MTFNDDARLDTGQISGGGGGGGGFRPGGMAIGGGGGCLSIIVLIVVVFLNGGLGGDGPAAPPPGQAGARPGYAPSAVSGLKEDIDRRCRTGADANRYDDCRVVGTVNSVQDYWRRQLPAQSDGSRAWRETSTVLYSGATRSACGVANNQVGPFYCPLDQKVYIDADFFRVLSSRFGADGGALAQMYVVAHEYGHALQDQLGLLARAQQDPKGARSGGVKIELMADCLAGLWAKDAATTKDADGRTLIAPLTRTDIDSALSAASAVGDDRIMKQAQGRVTPENFTHGTSEQRQRWFLAGYRGTSIRTCDTFAAASL